MRQLSLAFALLMSCEGSVVGGAQGLFDPWTPGRGPSPSGPGVGTDTPGTETPTFAPFQPGLFRPRVLLGSWYRNTVRDVLGDAAAAAVTVTPDVTEGGLVAIGSGSKSVTSADVTRIEENAFKAAQAAMADATARGRLIPCKPANASDMACMSQVVTSAGRRLFRRPASPEEVTRWTAIGLEAAKGYSDFFRGAEFVLAGLLQAPSFWYLDERGVEDAATGWRKLDPFELAARLSFFLVHTSPDDPLLEAAQSGALETPDAVRAQAERLLQRAEAREGVSSLFDEVFELDSLTNTQKSDPQFTRDVAASMRKELRLLFAHVAFDQSQDFRNLLSTRAGFVDSKLASLYGVTAPKTAFELTELPADRPGVLTRLGHLTNKAHDADTSPTHRGKLVRQRLLCFAVAMAPTDVVAMVPPPDANNQRTFRERLEDRTAETRCQGCHKLMDPLGFPFEGFDSLGRPRTTDNQRPVDTTGVYDTIFSRNERYAGPADFTALLREDERFTRCMTSTLFRQATGRFELDTEGKVLSDIHQTWKSNGFRLPELMIAIVSSDAFRFGKLE